MSINIWWGFYALGLVLGGFWLKHKAVRIGGVVLLLIVAGKVFFDLWGLSEIYRIISSIGLGILALMISFLYAKYREVIASKLL